MDLFGKATKQACTCMQENTKGHALLRTSVFFWAHSLGPCTCLCSHYMHMCLHLHMQNTLQTPSAMRLNSNSHCACTHLCAHINAQLPCFIACFLPHLLTVFECCTPQDISLLMCLTLHVSKAGCEVKVNI